jgi:hypothetical protein
MDEQHPGGEERCQKDVEVEGAGVDVGEETDECEGAEEDEGEEAGAVVVVEAVAGFEIGVRVVRVEDAGVEKSGIEGAGIEEAICGVDHPDGDEHGGGFCPREGEARAAGDEEGPECGDGGGVE